MKKRLLLVLTALTLSLGLVACSSNGDSSDKEESKSSKGSIKKYSSYEDLIDGLVNYINDRSMDKWDYVSMGCPYFCAEYEKTLENIACGMSDEYKDELEEDIQDAFEMIYDDFYEKYSENFEISIEIINREEMKNSELEKYKEDLKNVAKKYGDSDDEDDISLDSEEYYEDNMEDFLEDYEDASYDDDDLEQLAKAGEKFLEAFEEAEIEEGYELSCRVTISGDTGEYEYEEQYSCDIYVVKCGSYWYIADREWDDDVPRALMRLF